MKPPHLVEVVKRGGSWPALWDVALHLGSSRHTAGLQHLTRILTHHGHGLKPCPMCDECLMRRSLIDYILDAHGKELELPVLLSTDKLLILTSQWDLNFFKFINFHTSSLPLFYSIKYLSLLYLHI